MKNKNIAMTSEQYSFGIVQTLTTHFDRLLFRSLLEHPDECLEDIQIGKWKDTR